VRFVLPGVRVIALPDVPHQVAEDTGEVMVAAATARGRFPKLAAADYATESLTLGIPPESGAAPKRGAISFDQTT
jgi:hypothetical protein